MNERLFIHLLVENCLQYFTVGNSLSEQAVSMKSTRLTRMLVPQRRDTSQFGGVNMVPCGSLIWLEFRVGMMIRSTNELESRNQIMEHALRPQKESELRLTEMGCPLKVMSVVQYHLTHPF